MSENAQDFKLLAIRPLKGCDSKYRNNLIEGEFYQFYANYRFIIDHEKNVTAVEQTGAEIDIFSGLSKLPNPPKINISAIVGKNGSGKSSVVELFYLSCYLVAKNNNLIAKHEKQVIAKKEEKELAEIRQGLKLEVYFLKDNQYSCLVINPDFIGQEDKGNIKFYDLLSGGKFPLASLFYSVAVNYSIHGLNERTSGVWVARLFHKNDAYQTPLVINPFRDEGTIDVNAEMRFAQSRLLSNLRFMENSGGDLIPGRKIEKIEFFINRVKLNKIEDVPSETVFEELERHNDVKIFKVFSSIYWTFLSEKPQEDPDRNPDWENIAVQYSVGKLIRIAKNYYKTFYYESEGKIPGITNIPDLLGALKLDFSHVTLKLRQALYFYKNDPLRLDGDRVTLTDRCVTIPVDLFAQRIAEYTAQHPDRDPLEFIPLAPFSPRIKLEGGFYFHKLSSGEQQYIHSIQAVLYHILNVDSVFNYKGNVQKDSRTTYNFINVIFDEIELYFHPEFQRSLIQDFLVSLGNLSIPNIDGVNLLFLTHSPFILSDIPAGNVLRMEDGQIRKNPKPTFAANVHSMLADSFFMSSTIGAFAKYHCERIIKLYERTKIADKKEIAVLKIEYLAAREKFAYIVDQIGEDVIRGILNNHLDYLDLKLLIDEKTALKDILSRQLEVINKKLEDLE
ncbi:hypothetical protein D3C87_226870 [compost metagenome]